MHNIKSLHCLLTLVITGGLGTRFIKIAKIPIAKFLSKIFNFCLELEIFPDDLKIAEVVPVFKKGDPAEATNYRPISILYNLVKFLKN